MRHSREESRRNHPTGRGVRHFVFVALCVAAVAACYYQFPAGGLFVYAGFVTNGGRR